MIWVVIAIVVVGIGIVQAINRASDRAAPALPDPDVGACFVCQQVRRIYPFCDAPHRVCEQCSARARAEGYMLLPPPVGSGLCDLCGQTMPLHQPYVSMTPHCFGCWQTIHRHSQGLR